MITRFQEVYNFPCPGTSYSAQPSLELRLQDDHEFAEITGEVNNVGNGHQGIGHAPVQSPSLTFKIQESTDGGSTWTDVAGSEQTVVAGGRVHFTHQVAERFRVLAYGGTAGKMNVKSSARLHSVRT